MGRGGDPSGDTGALRAPAGSAAPVAPEKDWGRLSTDVWLGQRNVEDVYKMFRGASITRNGQDLTLGNHQQILDVFSREEITEMAENTRSAAAELRAEVAGMDEQELNVPGQKLESAYELISEASVWLDWAENRNRDSENFDSLISQRAENPYQESFARTVRDRLNALADANNTAGEAFKDGASITEIEAGQHEGVIYTDKGDPFRQRAWPVISTAAFADLAAAAGCPRSDAHKVIDSLTHDSDPPVFIPLVERNVAGSDKTLYTHNHLGLTWQDIHTFIGGYSKPAAKRRFRLSPNAPEGQTGGIVGLLRQAG